MIDMYRITIFFLVFAISCQKKEDGIRPIVKDITASVYAAGVIKSKGEYQLMSTVTGIIDQILVPEGSAVRKGQAILTISNVTAEYQKENAQLNAALNDLKANQDKVESLRLQMQIARLKMRNDSNLFEKQKSLWNQQIGSKNEFDQRKLAYESSRTSYKNSLLQHKDFIRQQDIIGRQARNTVKISEKQVADYTLRSEATGILYALNKKQGELISPQMIIGVVGRGDSFLMEVQVDESDIVRIKPGQKVAVSLESYPDTVFMAHVSKVYPFMNERTRSFKVEAAFDELPPRLYPNLTLEANIITDEKKNALLIPSQYLLANDSLLLKSGKKVKVKTGLKDYQNTEILNGLTAQDEIILPGK